MLWSCHVAAATARKVSFKGGCLDTVEECALDLHEQPELKETDTQTPAASKDDLKFLTPSPTGDD